GWPPPGAGRPVGSGDSCHGAALRRLASLARELGGDPELVREAAEATRRALERATAAPAARALEAWRLAVPDVAPLYEADPGVFDALAGFIEDGLHRAGRRLAELRAARAGGEG
ncbi:MAG: hypothetical protein ACLF0P_17425, partial [Thermoanaerobaculia bacterium]